MSGTIKRIVAFTVLAAACYFVRGCINVVPAVGIGSASEKGEAKGLLKVLRRLAPELKDLLLRERNTANQIRITLDETAASDPVGFRHKLKLYTDDLIDVRNKREQISVTISQGNWETPLVFAVQQSAVRMLRDEISRTDGWIQDAQNIQLRADLGEGKSFPELTTLTKHLDAFLTQVLNEPLRDHIRELVEEYRLGEAE